MASPSLNDNDSNAAVSVPSAFGRYQLLELIAKGGMAEVYRARLGGAAGTEKVVCIKRILPHLSKNGEFVKLFVQEAKIALPLSHGNITQVFDFGEVDGTFFLAMEYIRGGNLAQVLERAKEGGGIEVAAGLFIGAEVCRGLQYAHGYTDSSGQQLAVVHRDVSPHNILISYDGEVKLADFGIALAATKAGAGDEVVRGKPCYLSPEQADGNAGDARSDIFSLGAVLYEVFTGVRPFEGESDAETMQRVREARVDPPSKHNRELESELDRVVLKALARDPAQRYQRAGDLQVELTQALHRLAPAYTADKLKEKMRDLFAWELAQAEQGADGTRDRLLFQLSRAGVKVDGKQTSTDELLQMGTVAIGGGSLEQRSRGWIWIVIAAVLAIGGTTAALLLGDGASPKVDAGPPSANLPRHDPTEHLTPASLREPVDEPPAPTSQPHRQPVDPGKKNGAKRPTPTRRQIAYLNCNSWPWSVVYLNGRRLQGNTPLYRVKVVAGRHRLRFVNSELRLSKEVTVSVGPGSTKTVAVSLQQ